MDKWFVIYLACEILIAVISVLGNALVITVFLRDRRMRTPTNLYIFSLAVTDLLTSTVAVPVYLHSMLTLRPRNFYACLYVNTLILTFCTVSILHLAAVSYDRYMAIVWHRKTRSNARGMRHAAFLIILAWILGGLIGSLPVMGWHGGIPPQSAAPKCEFMKVIRMSYLLFLFYATIVLPTVVMIFFYGSIYHTVKKHNVRMTSVDYSHNAKSSKPRSERIEGQFLADSTPGDAENEGNENSAKSLATTSCLYKQHKKRNARTNRVIISLALVIACFFVAWYPLYIMNAVVYYCDDCHIEFAWFYVPIILSHLSSAINPFIYARTMPGYKEAFIEALACKKVPDQSSVNRRRQNEALGAVIELQRAEEEETEEEEEIEEVDKK